MRIKALRLMLTDLAKQLAHGIAWTCIIVFALAPAVAGLAHSVLWWLAYPAVAICWLLLNRGMEYWLNRAIRKVDDNER